MEYMNSSDCMNSTVIDDFIWIQLESRGIDIKYEY